MLSFVTLRKTTATGLLGLLSACAFSNPMGSVDPQNVKDAVSSATASNHCPSSYGSAEVISAEMAGMSAGMPVGVENALSGNIIKPVVTIAQSTNCFSIIQNDAGQLRAQAYNGQHTAKPKYIISVQREGIMPTYGKMMGNTLLNLATFGGLAMSGRGGATTKVTMTITKVQTGETITTGSFTDDDPATASAKAMQQALLHFSP